MATNYPEVKVDSQIDDMLKAISDNLDLTEVSIQKYDKSRVFNLFFTLLFVLRHHQ